MVERERCTRAGTMPGLSVIDPVVEAELLCP